MYLSLYPGPVCLFIYKQLDLLWEFKIRIDTTIPVGHVNKYSELRLG